MRGEGMVRGWRYGGGWRCGGIVRGWRCGEGVEVW